MIIFEIITPGSMLDYEDSNWATKIYSQLFILQSKFFEANLALNLFITSNKNISYIDNDKVDNAYTQNEKRKQEILKGIKKEYLSNNMDYHTYCDEINFQAKILFKREQWSKGFLPDEFKHRLPSIYAHAFIHALDTFEKYLGVLSKEDNVPESIKKIHKDLIYTFPSLRGVRNTLEHTEDRSRGLGAPYKGQPPKPLNLKPFNESGGTCLIIDTLFDNKLVSTMSDGKCGEVDISPESLTYLQNILIDTLQSFKWKGPKQHLPDTWSYNF